MDLEIGMRSICSTSTMFDKTAGTAEEQLARRVDAARIVRSRIVRAVLGNQWKLIEAKSDKSRNCGVRADDRDYERDEPRAQGHSKELQSVPPGGSWEESFWLRPSGF